MTSRLGTGIWLTFFYSVVGSEHCPKQTGGQHLQRVVGSEHGPKQTGGQHLQRVVGSEHGPKQTGV